MKTFDGGLLKAQNHDVVFGIDQSLTGFGLAAISTTSDDYIAWVYKSSYRGVDRLLDIQQWLDFRLSDVLARDHEIIDFAMESGVVMSNSALVLGELSAAVKLFLADSYKPFRPLQVPPTSLKKFVTGKGNAGKEEVVLGAYKHWGVEFTDNNACDAYCLARLIRGNHAHKYQQEVYDKLTADPKFRDAAVMAG